MNTLWIVIKFFNLTLIGYTSFVYPIKVYLNKYVAGVLALIEGAALMVCEIGTVKLIEPYLGVSMNTWASILAVTLIGLAIGYFLGGLLSKNQKKNTLSLLFLYQEF